MEEFYSQICTTIEQSQRLLDLRLNPETADMVYTNASLPYNKDVFHVICKEYPKLNKEVNYEISPFTFIPAWSLHRLIELLNPKTVDFAMSTIYGAYEDVIYNISISIKSGTFNKEYLKQ